MKFIAYIFSLLFLFNNSYGASIIRDDEIENAIKQIVFPIAKNTNLDGKLNIHIINDSSINAFATKGNNIFINSGLIVKSKTPDMLAGVIAHEIGHINAGHPLFRQEELINTQIFDVASILLGVASIIAGNPDIGASIVIGGSQIGKNRFLEYSRNQEQAADQAAISLLKKSEIPLDGTIDILKFISRYDNKSFRNIYTRTHPFASDRANIVKGHIHEGLNFNKYKYIDKQVYDFARVKLEAYISENKGREYIKTIQNSDSYENLYAKSIVNTRSHKFIDAHKKIDLLISKFPNNPYFYEHKAQIYFEERKFDKAAESYKKALAKLTNSELLNIQLALCYISIAETTNKNQYVKDAIIHIEKSIAINKDSYISYQLGVRAFGMLPDNISKEYFLSKLYLITNEKTKAKHHALIAKNLMNKNHKYYAQTLDILND